VVEIRPGDTWHNAAALRPNQGFGARCADARVRQTTAVLEETAALLKELGLPFPPELNGIEPIQA